MAFANDGYSRLIQWLKILLPIAALALLSTVFLLSRTNDATETLPYADIETGPNGLVERILEPSFAGSTEDGDLISFRADVARPTGEGIGNLEAENVVADIELRAGNSISFTADLAMVDQPSAEARLRGDVRITSSVGYQVETEELRTGLDSIRASTEGEIRGTGPVGTFRAGQMLLTAGDDGGDVQMVFTNGVKLVYTPQSD
ncbi:hypothetical protein ACRARG_10875 [Pseudooceanicola sp. C21-150M6]|uniref:hypothetical protein n=1 Tax=Pseudooceanicola sp. C21-150M6 TaxID=3434355 RepID=UPI003D7F1A3B